MRKEHFNRLALSAISSLSETDWYHCRLGKDFTALIAHELLLFCHKIPQLTIFHWFLGFTGYFHKIPFNIILPVYLTISTGSYLTHTVYIPCLQQRWLGSWGVGWGGGCRLPKFCEPSRLGFTACHLMTEQHILFNQYTTIKHSYIFIVYREAKYFGLTGLSSGFYLQQYIIFTILSLF